jgi:chromosome partitioning protein
VEQVRPLNPELRVLGVLLSKYNARRTLTQAVEEQLEKNVRGLLGCGVFETKIDFTVDIPSSQACGQSLADYKKNSKAAANYRALSEEILRRYAKEIKKL